MKIFIDENLPPFLAKGLHILEQPMGDGFEVLSIKDVFGKGVRDEDWIPEVGKLKGVVITQDKNIYRTKPQRDLFERHDVGVFFISPPKGKGYTYWQMVELLVNHWKDIKDKCSTQRPFSFICRPRSGFKRW